MPFNFQLLRELLQLGTRENFHQRMVDLSFTNLNFRPIFTSLNPLPMDRAEGNHYLGGYLFSMTEGMPRPYWMSVTFCSKGNFQFYSKLKFYKWPFSTEQAKQTQGAKGRGDYWLYLDSTSNIWRQNPSLLHHSHPTPWNAIDFSGYLELYDIFWCSIDCPNKQAKKNVVTDVLQQAYSFFHMQHSLPQIVFSTVSIPQYQSCPTLLRNWTRPCRQSYNYNYSVFPAKQRNQHLGFKAVLSERQIK